MKYRPLGATGLQVSEIGFGAWGIGGARQGAMGYGPTDDEQSKRALRRAFDSGINFYDTADLYGFGYSEELIGEVFQGVRDKVVIASKVGIIDSSGAQNFSPKHIRDSLEGSLRRLRSDYLDLYQLHDPPMGLLLEDPSVLEMLRHFQREGKIRAFGVSLHSPEDGLTAIHELKIACLQFNFSLVDQRGLKNGLMDFCRQHKTGVIVRTPLCFGFLADTSLKSRDFDAQDHRRRWSRDQVNLWSDAGSLFSAVLDDRRQTAAQKALRFCLSFKAVSTVIPGMLCEEQVDENVLASDMGTLGVAEMAKIEKIFKEHAFFLGLKGTVTCDLKPETKK